MNKSPCQMCRATGRKKLRRRARGKGTRYGACRFCNALGYRIDRGHRVAMAPLSEVSLTMLQLLFYGNP